jgi:glycosyltransferase involved in cell wall biosynthesis
MRILHTAAGLWTSTGGPASSVPGLCAELANLGHDVTLLTGEGELSDEVKQLRSVRVVTAKLGPYRLANYSAQFAKKCRDLAQEADVLHTHGLWLHPNFVSSRIARKNGRPIVISPRGMLAPWALNQRKVVKRLIWTLGQRRALTEATLVHVTSAEEAEDVRRTGIAAPIVVIANGVDLSAFPLSDIEALRRTGRDRVIAFVSRIHPKKGLDILLDAWRGVAERSVDAKLIIAGPGEERHIRELRDRLESGSLTRAYYVGTVSGREKLRLLATSRAVVLPSRSENYGMIVAEALACGTPVITTMNVPWPDITAEQCGWRVDGNVDDIRAALDDALARPAEQLEEMGSRGRRLIELRHSTVASARQMEKAYAAATGLPEANA